MTPRFVLPALLLCVAGAVPATAADEEDPVTLRVSGETVVLAGIAAPPRAALCGEPAEEWRCGRIAELALRQRLQGGETQCDERDADGVATCSIAGEDLSLWLLDAGWARTRPDAPDHYLATEQAARAARRGIWRDGSGRWRLADQPQPDCDVCAARHARVTGAVE